MKKAFFVIMGIMSASCFAVDNVPLSLTPGSYTPDHDSTGFVRTVTGIQANYNEMYRALPLDQQNKVLSASVSMEDIRLRPPLEASTILASERDRAEISMKTTVSLMTLTDAVRTQIENARHEINQRLSEKILDLKARRASRR